MAGLIENTQWQDDFTATFQPLSIANYKRRALEKLFQGPAAACRYRRGGGLERLEAVFG